MHSTPAQVSAAFHRACRKAQIEDFCFHDLRHAAAGWFRMKGADNHCSTVTRVQRSQNGSTLSAPQRPVSCRCREAFGRRLWRFTLPRRYRTREADCSRGRKCLRMSGVPNGIRTRVAALKARCPRPSRRWGRRNCHQVPGCTIPQNLRIFRLPSYPQKCGAHSGIFASEFQASPAFCIFRRTF
jgi:hypothetical protein